MLRRSTSKEALMEDYNNGPLLSPLCKRSSSSFLSSPRLFNGSLASKGYIDSESMMSPTSILDQKPFSAFINPFWYDTTTPKSRKTSKSPKNESKISWDKLNSRGVSVSVSLGLVDVLSEEIFDSRIVKSDSRVVLFGSQLKIKIPSLPTSVVCSTESSKSPPEFGTKTRKSQFGLSNPGSDSVISPRVFTPFSASEMELSEEYTCVISHGPNPRTTHIFDDCIVESCCGVSRFSESRKEDRFSENNSTCYSSEKNFLGFCYYCKKNLGQGNDIYMYSSECRCRCKEMMIENGIETTEFDDLYLKS